MLTSFLCITTMALCATLAWLVRGKGWLHPAVVFVGMAVADVLFPAIYWLAEGQVNNPEWLPPVTPDQIEAGILFYVPFFMLFLAGLLFSAPGKVAWNGHALRVPSAAFERRLVRTTLLFLILTLLQWVMDVQHKGGLSAWFWSKFVFSAVSDGAQPEAGGLLETLPLREILQALIGLGFFYRHQLRRQAFFGAWMPAVAVTLALLTFLRGTVLACAVTLIFAEVLRQQCEPRLTRGRGRQGGALAMSVIALLLSIYAYGAIRDRFRGAVSGSENDGETVVVPTFVTAGHGLLGVTHIVANYGSAVDYLGGKTYVDMLLLPVPRIIYTSKPSWYGIDDITRGMGWPETTQSAVTMPGEAYANFGAWGLLLAVPLGAFFGLLNRAVTRHPVQALLLGPTVLFIMPLVANWMAFTGIMNAMPLTVLLALLAFFLKGAMQPLPRERAMSLSLQPGGN